MRAGAAIDIVATRFRENRSQLVFTTARGRDAVFWQSPRTRKQARPQVSLPTARAAGIAELEIVVDAHERYAYRFAGQQVRTTSRGLPCGDYGIILDGTLVAAVERKSMPDLIGSLTSGRLRYALGELAALPRAAVVVEDRYSQIFKQDRVRPALVADGIAECQVRWPNVPIVFCETRSLAEEWTYRYLAAAHAWATTEAAAVERIGEQPTLRPVPEPQTGPPRRRSATGHDATASTSPTEDGSRPPSAKHGNAPRGRLTPDIPPQDVLGWLPLSHRRITRVTAPRGRFWAPDARVVGGPTARRRSPGDRCRVGTG